MALVGVLLAFCFSCPVSCCRVLFFCKLALFLVCFSFVFVLCLVFLSNSDYGKHMVSPASPVLLGHVGDIFFCSFMLLSWFPFHNQCSYSCGVGSRNAPFFLFGLKPHSGSVSFDKGQVAKT